ncbi:MAG TPA: hypothetical protein DER09_13735 [Prolixibacteraceae bacterium]|nr:hypothetical protein [Prolixibacteraceae bacterium]
MYPLATTTITTIKPLQSSPPDYHNHDNNDNHDNIPNITTTTTFLPAFQPDFVSYLVCCKRFKPPLFGYICAKL